MRQWQRTIDQYTVVLIHPGVIQYLVERNSLRWHHLQKRADEILRTIGRLDNLKVKRSRQLVDNQICAFPFERRDPAQHGVQNGAKTPGIDSDIVIEVRVDLWRTGNNLIQNGT
jgi:hypothetical protein